MHACTHTTRSPKRRRNSQGKQWATAASYTRPPSPQPHALLRRKDTHTATPSLSGYSRHCQPCTTHTQPLQPAPCLLEYIPVLTKPDSCSAAASCAGLATHGAESQKALPLSHLQPCPHPSLPHRQSHGLPMPPNPFNKRVQIQQQQRVTLHYSPRARQCTPVTPVTPPTPCYTQQSKGSHRTRHVHLRPLPAGTRQALPGQQGGGLMLTRPLPVGVTLWHNTTSQQHLQQQRASPGDGTSPRAISTPH